jgi:hypothetical protein
MRVLSDFELLPIRGGLFSSEDAMRRYDNSFRYNLCKTDALTQEQAAIRAESGLYWLLAPLSFDRLTPAQRAGNAQLAKCEKDYPASDR